MHNQQRYPQVNYKQQVLGYPLKVAKQGLNILCEKKNRKFMF